MQLSLQLSKLQGTTSYFDGNMGRVGVKSDTVSQGLAGRQLGAAKRQTRNKLEAKRAVNWEPINIQLGAICHGQKK
jgi:hypothetical protein